MAFRGYWRRITTRAGLVLTVSEFTASEMRQIGGLNPDRICVTPLGVDSRRFGEEAPDVGGDGFLYVGNIKPHKNLMKLLDAWEHVAPQVEGNLCIVGRRDGFFTSDRKIQRRIRSLGSRVEFSGEVDDLTLAAYYRKATALVLPSLYEGFGLPVLEAMSLGCPVIAANTSALPETGGAAALYFPPLDQNALAECMLRLASNSALRVQMREAGLIRARQYTWDRTAEFTAAAFRRLLG
jgi:glycosyltransferase involved in cell wall biosynthesis